MDKLTILADDLTGALDTGVFFASMGASVSLSGEMPDTACRLSCLGTRHLSPEAAFSRTAQALEGAEGAVYFKTDSLLRGHIGAGLEALCKARGTVFFAPAYPAMGRTVEDGTVLVHGTPLLESVYAQDARNPVKHEKVAEIIAEEASVPVLNITPDSPIPADFRGVLICDAKTDAELDRAALKALDAGLTAFAGCAGFAQAIARAVKAGEAPDMLALSSDRLFVVSASVHPATLEQLSTARSLGVPGVWLYDGGRGETQQANAAQKAARILKSGDCVLLAAAFGDVQRSKVENTFKALRMSPDETAQTIVSELAEAASRVLSRASAAVFVIGGDTLAAFCEKTGIVRISPRMSLAPGIIGCEAEDARGRIKSLITKAGSFGDAACILDLADEFRKSV